MAAINHKISSLPIIIRQIGDALTIFLSSLLSNIIFLQEFNVGQILVPSVSLTVFLLIVFIPTNYFMGIYNHVRRYKQSHKIIKILQSSMIAGLLMVLIFTVFNS